MPKGIVKFQKGVITEKAESNSKSKVNMKICQHPFGRHIAPFDIAEGIKRNNREKFELF